MPYNDVCVLNLVVILILKTEHKPE